MNSVKKFLFSIQDPRYTISGHYFCFVKVSDSELKKLALHYAIGKFGEFQNEIDCHFQFKHMPSGNYASYYCDVKINPSKSK
jgi:hypothetical protein